MPMSALAALLHIAGFIDDQHRARVTKVAGDVVRRSSRTPSASQRARPSRCCIPPGDRSPACSAIDQQFFLGRSASNPRTNARARRRGSTRPNRPAIRPISSSNISGHRAGSTLASAATARSSRVHTTRDDHRGGRSCPARHTATSRTTAGVLSDLSREGTAGPLMQIRTFCAPGLWCGITWLHPGARQIHAGGPGEPDWQMAKPRGFWDPGGRLERLSVSPGGRDRWLPACR
jgi:hypothetical protein